MSTTRWEELSFDDRMATVEFRVGERAHIVVDSDICRSCTTKACVSACPANLFAPIYQRCADHPEDQGQQKDNEARHQGLVIAIQGSEEQI